MSLPAISGPHKRKNPIFGEEEEEQFQTAVMFPTAYRYVLARSRDCKSLLESLVKTTDEGY